MSKNKNIITIRKYNKYLSGKYKKYKKYLSGNPNISWHFCYAHLKISEFYFQMI